MKGTGDLGTVGYRYNQTTGEAEVYPVGDFKPLGEDEEVYGSVRLTGEDYAKLMDAVQGLDGVRFIDLGRTTNDSATDPEETISAVVVQYPIGYEALKTLEGKLGINEVDYQRGGGLRFSGK